MNLTNHQIVAAHHAVVVFLGRADLTTKARYVLLLNHEALQRSVDTMQKALPQSEAIQAFEAKRQALFMEYADKLENGDAVLLNGVPQIPPSRRDAFQSALAALLAEYQKPINDYRAAEAELLSMPTDIKLFVIKVDMLPDTGVSNDQLAALMPILKTA